EPDPELDVFRWCRRWWGIDIGTVDGWLPGTLTRLHEAAWLTILGPTFAKVLARRLKLEPPITVTRSRHGAIIRAGDAPSLVDVARGEPALVADVARAIAPLVIRGYDERGWMRMLGTTFTTMTSELSPLYRHKATAAFVNRFLDPAGWLAPT